MTNYDYLEGLQLLKEQRENLDQIIQFLDQMKVQLTATEDYLETHLLNYLFQLSSVELLARGSKIVPSSEGLFIDLSSLYSLTRAVMENYFTIHYLYFEPKDNFELAKYRYLLYNIHGLNIRQNMTKEIEPHPVDKPKLQEEKETLELYIKELEKNSVFLGLRDDKRKSLLKSKPPRDVSYTQLLSKPYFKSPMFRQTWEHVCNYAHTEFIGVMQLHTIFKNPALLKATPSLTRQYIFTVIMLTSSLFINLNGRFQEVKIRYETFSPAFRESNEYWYSTSQGDL